MAALRISQTEVVADQIVALLRHGRTIGRRPGGKVEPLGVLVTSNVEVVGLRDRQLRLSWSVLERSGATPLPEVWHSRTIEYLLNATSDRDTGTMDFWVPMPKAPGQYFVRLTLSTDGALLTSADSPDFG
jgi:hypothetical protein